MAAGNNAEWDAQDGQGLVKPPHDVVLHFVAVDGEPRY
jgi:hypothetical protein